jgi:four helix bundle protein
MIIKSLDDLQVFQSANQLAAEVSALLDRPRFQQFPELRRQLADASAAIGPRICEGFGQGTDRHCAHYQRLARGSANEMVAHLAVAFERHCLSAAEYERLVNGYTVLGKRLSRWIKHLMVEDRKTRS